MKRRSTFFTVAYGLGGLLTAFLLSWILLAQFNFFYGFWHDHAGIGEGIEEYGPQNRYRDGFADTSREERVRLFRAINEAIHSSGKGLAEIEYHSASQAAPQPLLRDPEIRHLQDVANLVDMLLGAGGFIALFWITCCAWLIWGRRPLPALKQQLVGIGAGLLVVVVAVLLIGPERVFNQLHIWIFPADNPWFFYYQDSLMSTMMLAPHLFGWIAIAWLPLAVGCFLLLHWVVVRIRDLVEENRD